MNFFRRKVLVAVAVSVLVAVLVFMVLMLSHRLKERVDECESLHDRNTSLVERVQELEATGKELEASLLGLELPTYEYSDKDIELLARCVQSEAGDYEEAPNAQRYVAQVVLNRVKSGKFPNTIYDVVYQKRGRVPQFSVAHNGALESVNPSLETYVNVYSVIVNGTDLPEEVMYFYDSSVRGNWVNTLRVHDIVEGTVFAIED